MALKKTVMETELFGGLPAETLQAISDLADTRAYQEGDTIYAFGDDARDLYLVAQGRVRFSLGVGNRPDGAGSVMTEGALFGWAAVLDQQPRRVATATCLEDCSLIVLPASQLLALFEQDTRAGYVVMRRLATMVARDYASVLSV